MSWKCLEMFRNVREKFRNIREIYIYFKMYIRKIIKIIYQLSYLLHIICLIQKLLISRRVTQCIK